MTIWGAFTNSIEAMQAQSDAMDVISQNIANVNTVGYKNSVDNFQTVLSTETANTDIFGVQVARQYNNDVQGTPISTGIWDNLAINGQGFFILNSAINGSGTTSYTRAGDFAEAVLPSSVTGAGALTSQSTDDAAYLTDGLGDYLMGWKATNGVASTSNSLSGLTAVNFTPGSILPGQATTAVTLQGSIPSNAANSSTPAEPQTIQTNLTTTNTTTTPGFSASTTEVYKTGTLQIQLGTIDSTTGTFTSSGSAVTVNITDGSLQGIASAINAANAGVTATVTQDAQGNSQLEFSGAAGASNGFVITGTDTGGTGQSLAGLDYSASNTAQNATNYTASSAAANANTGNPAVSGGIPIYDTSGNAQTLALNFTKTGADTWTVSYGIDPTVGTITSPTSTTTTPTTLTFDGAGNFVSQSGASSVAITWANGTTSTISVDFSQMSQLASGNLIVNSATQNGYASATMVKAEFDSNGNLYGDYSNGQKVLLYTLPVANFVAPDALESTSGTLFRQTAAAGALNVDPVTALNDTSITPGALESSNVDLSAEFSRIITTQTAYNTASKLFSTSNQMIETVRDLVT